MISAEVARSAAIPRRAQTIHHRTEQTQAVVLQERVGHLLILKRDKHDVERSLESLIAQLVHLRLDFVLLFCIVVNRVGLVAIVVANVALTTTAADLKEPAAVIRMHQRTLRGSLKDLLACHFSNVYAVSATFHAHQLARVVCKLNIRNNQVWICFPF